MNYKILYGLLKNRKIRKTAAAIIVSVLSPVILVIVILCALFSNISEHNSSAVEMSFGNNKISSKVPIEYANNIENMRVCFKKIDKAIDNIEADEKSSIDALKIKAVFYSLYFGNESILSADPEKFTDCFISLEKQKRAFTDYDGNVSYEEYTEAVYIKNMKTVYENISICSGKAASHEEAANAEEIYYRILYGKSAPVYGKEFDDFVNSLADLDIPPPEISSICSPFDYDWKGAVTSEFGERKDPFTGKKTVHGGIDLGMPKGSPIHSVLEGAVKLVRYSNTGYGYHVIIDHGGGVVTLYAHCSKIDVFTGQEIKANEVIAYVGSTGKSTGNHLHFEIRLNGIKQNPRNYLK